VSILSANVFIFIFIYLFIFLSELLL